MIYYDCLQRQIADYCSKIFKSKIEACLVNPGHYIAFKHCTIFATDLAAKFECNRFRIMPDIVSKLLRGGWQCAPQSEVTARFDSNLSRRPFLGQVVNLDLLLSGFAQDSIQNNWFWSYHIFTQRPMNDCRRLRNALCLCSLVRPAQAVPERGCPKSVAIWFCSNNLRLSSWIAVESACQMTNRGSNLDSNLISAAEPPDQWVLEVLSAPKPPNKVQWICGVWILFRRPELRTAVSRYQPSSTRLTKIQLLIYPIETKILNNNKTDNRFVIITDEIDPDMLMDTNNYSVIRGKWI